MKKGYLTLINSGLSQQFYNSFLTIITIGLLGLGSGWAQDADADGISNDDENLNCVGGVVNHFYFVEDFGTGNRGSSPYTTYTYEDGTNVAATPGGTQNVDDSEYALVQFAAPYDINLGASSYTWVTTGDHTGNANGRMAVFNADATVDEFYRRTVTDVRPNVDANLRLYLKNIVTTSSGPVILPNIVVEVRDASSNLLFSASSGDIPQDELWREFDFTFNPGANSTIEIIIKNNAAVGVGNDLAFDDISLSQGLCDTDFDGIANQFDLDSDNDGILDSAEGNIDTDLDGVPNFRDVDSDGDGCFDALEGAGNFTLTDIDSNGALTGGVNAQGVPLVAGPGQGLTAILTDNTLMSAACDADADTIHNNTDLDDDGDGILDEDENLNCVGPTLVNTILFEDFGTGNRTSSPYTNYCYEDGFGNAACTSDPGSKHIDDGDYAILQFASPYNVNIGGSSYAWTSNGDHTGNVNGRMAVFNASFTAGEFYNRTLTGLIPNTATDVSLWIKNIVSPGSNFILPNITIEVRDLANVLINSFNTADIAEDGLWHNFSLNFNPGANTDVRLILVNNAPGGNGNDIAFDDILVTQTVCDTDNDGIPNHLDFDSDNDGILDVVEGAGDFDLDSRPNYLDLDSDNDGIPDNIEGQTTLGYTVPSGNDTDNDGIDDAYDADNGGTPIVPVDSDIDTAPDYLDVDADNDGISDTVEAGLVLSAADVDTDGLDDGVDADLTGYADPGGTIDDPLAGPVILPDTDGDVNTGGDVDYRDGVDTDNDTVADLIDLDDDNDGIPDVLESGGNNPNGDADGDGIMNWQDVVDDATPGDGSTTDYTDSDSNGIPDVYDADGDGVPNHLDLDSDNDGIFDVVESGFINPINNVVDTNEDGRIDAATPLGVGTNGLFDNLETAVDSGVLALLPADSDTDNILDSNEIDADGDGCFDVFEAGFSDPDVNGYLGTGTFGLGLTVDGDGVVTSGVDGYTTPADGDSNSVYDFQEVGQAVSLTTSPTSTTIVIGTTANFDITGSAAVYRWQESTDGGATWSNISNGGSNPTYSGATTDELTIADVPLPYDGYQYRVILSSPAFRCDGNITSAVATLNLFNDNDMDGIPDADDLDDDNDGIPDTDEQGGLNPDADNDSDGIPAYLDDDDNDPVLGNADGLVEAAYDNDGDGIPNHFDLDSDNDGIYDLVESGQIDALNNVVDTDNNGIIDAANAGTVGANGLFDPLETAVDSGVLANATADSDTDGTPDSNEPNSDGDGCNDTREAGFVDGDANGFLGNGTPGAGLVTDANGVVTGQGGYTEPDDNDANGIYDFQEVGAAVSITTQPSDQNVMFNANANFDVTGTSPVYQWQESTDGGVSWANVSNVGIYSGANTATLTINANNLALAGNQYRVILSSPAYACDGNLTSDPATLNFLSDVDGDGVADADDLDSDNDGIPDTDESGGLNPYTDGDGDGVPLYLDDDDGNPGVGDVDGLIEAGFDTDGDGVPNHLDLDSDNDGIYDLVESGQIDALNNVVDTDNNGIIDAANAGTVGANGLFDPLETAVDSGVLANSTADSDTDGTPDSNEPNSDGDGCNDTREAGFVDGDANGFLGNGTPGAGLVTDANGVVTGQGGYTEPDDNDANGIYDFQEVGVAVSIATQPSDDTVILNATANFDVTGTSPVYQWQESTDGGATWNNLTNVGIYSGADTASLAINANSLTLNGNQYRVILSSPGYACDGNITSDPATLTVLTDNDGDGIPDNIDLDDDNDGIPDSVEGTGDLDGDGVPNHFDLDADGDGVYDTNEAGFADLDADNDGVIDGVAADFGANGLFNGVETDDTGAATINYTLLNTDGDGNPNFLDVDDDGDGVNTLYENANPDGNLDPADAQDTDGDLVPDYLDIDDDGDGVNTMYEVSNADNDGNPSTGVAILNTDGDLLPNYLDNDDDNDGILTLYENDNSDGDGNPTTGIVINTDNDSVPDYLDRDDDNDGILTAFENPDANGDGNPADAQDSDGNGVPDYMDIDDDGDGVNTIFENPDPNNDGNPNDAQDTDGDAVPDYLDIDDDNDNILTENENPDPNGDGNPADAVDTDNDSIPDYLDNDDDNDGILTVDEDVDGDGDPTNDDTDGDGVPNYLDIDDDGDGILTLTEGPADVDNDGFPNYLDQDADNDGIPDNVEGQLTASYVNPQGDADGNGLDDAYEVGTNGIIPVNSDGTDNPDYLDTDSDNDTVPDSTEGHDFNADGEADILPSGVDSDQDGLDDAYDGSVGDFADPNGLTVIDNPANDLPNRDSTDEVDYRDTDDDNDGLLTADEDGDEDGDPRNDNCDEDAFPDYLDTTSCTIIPNGFSPNGDGDNDTFIIPALAQFDNFEMEVYDRWGNIVYEYKNNGRVQPIWWDGFSDGPRTISKKKKVPAGTYYYIIRYNQDGIAPVAGWVYVNY